MLILIRMLYFGTAAVSVSVEQKASGESLGGGGGGGGPDDASHRRMMESSLGIFSDEA